MEYSLYIKIFVGILAIVRITLLLAEPIGKRLGVTGLNIATRIRGLLLSAIGIQMIAEGVAAVVPRSILKMQPPRSYFLEIEGMTRDRHCQRGCVPYWGYSFSKTV